MEERKCRYESQTPKCSILRFEVHPAKLDHIHTGRKHTYTEEKRYIKATTKLQGNGKEKNEKESICQLSDLLF
jgi:hypothetical protein